MRKILIILILGLLILTSISAFSVAGMQVKTADESYENKFTDTEIAKFESADIDPRVNLPDINGNNIVSYSITSGRHRLVLGPPWNTDVDKKKDIWGIGDAWQEGTELNGEYGETTLHSWAGPGAGMAGITLYLHHYDYFRPTVDAYYNFKFKYKMEGIINLDSFSGILGASAARGIVSFDYNLEDYVDKKITYIDKISIGGVLAGIYPYSITESYSQEVHLAKGESYMFWVTGVPSAVSDGFVECPGFSTHYVTYAGLQEVIIEWDNHAPNPPSDPSPSNGAVNAAIGTTLKWLGSDPDGDVDSLEYDVYFGTDSLPDSDELVSSGQKSVSYKPPSDLNYETKYYWKIVARDSSGETTSGPVWSFTTKEKEGISKENLLLSLLNKNAFGIRFLESLSNSG